MGLQTEVRVIRDHEKGKSREKSPEFYQTWLCVFISKMEAGWGGDVVICEWVFYWVLMRTELVSSMYRTVHNSPKVVRYISQLHHKVPIKWDVQDGESLLNRKLINYG
jgi:hypothetical protein